MMIPRERLNGKEVQQLFEQTMRRRLDLAKEGRKLNTSKVMNVLVKAAIEGKDIESVMIATGSPNLITSPQARC